jgi:lipopolysaccharide transport system ATP-binding protein
VTDTVISAEHLSKSYLVGHNAAEHDRYVALRDVIVRGASNFVRKAADMARGRQIIEGDTVEEFWALKDVSFEVRRGEVLGVIGRNGAGKSTLLKILSRITEPTEGRVRIRGRVSSLLEVGTGFHPELTGRENIYLNGAILSMTREEIKRKFDKIVDFSGVENFIDTPVKRYSSGMYVRLAFAVAAHLEPEILVVDEVLAVGDGEFQKKCLGQMAEVASGGRTILFVSHNMAMINSLCEKAILLEEGVLRKAGAANDVILNYVSSGESSPAAVNCRNNNRQVGDKFVQLLSADIRDAQGATVSQVEIDQSFSARMEYRIKCDVDRVFIPNFHFYRQDGNCAFVTVATDVKRFQSGEYAAECHIPANFLNDGMYSVGFCLTSFEHGVSVHFYEKGAVMFTVRDPIGGVPTRAGYSGAMPGAVRPLLPWTFKRID